MDSEAVAPPYWMPGTSAGHDEWIRGEVDPTMTGTSSLTPWLILIGLGAFHGLNPAMGWLFAVALGLYRKSWRVVLLSLIPIALGHALAIAVVVYAVGALGLAIHERALQIVSGLLLIAWGLYHALYGHKHRFRIGMTTGLLGLGVWSFVMATAHGAGMMLIPVLLPLEHAGDASAHAGHAPAMTSFAIASLAVLVHSLAMLVTTGTVALIVYEWVGLDFLSRGWINVDLLWTAALILMGLWLLLS
ncbi:MAG: hypothetical protein ACRECX_04925 [Methyloceanibacter sp.]|uniref:hypothetical protein n=1 Tax=Methyloceanibacter sp. TaxID=1965321 RepID=UPI003D6D78C7